MKIIYGNMYVYTCGIHAIFIQREASGQGETQEIWSYVPAYNQTQGRLDQMHQRGKCITQPSESEITCQRSRIANAVELNVKF